jgi:hypothetical protein
MSFTSTATKYDANSALKRYSFQVRPIDTTPTLTTLTMKFYLSITITLLCVVNTVFAGPISYGICQAGCATIVMACYSAAGATWGVTAGVSAPATVLACNVAFGKCQAACWIAAGVGP